MFFVCRPFEIFKRSTIALGIVSILLLLCCMVCCFCCLKKRGEVYILRNAQGHLRNSDENIPMSAAERGEMNPQEELRMVWILGLLSVAIEMLLVEIYHIILMLMLKI